jgi:hypothetical protein
VLGCFLMVLPCFIRTMQEYKFKKPQALSERISKIAMTVVIVEFKKSFKKELLSINQKKEINHPKNLLYKVRIIM